MSNYTTIIGNITDEGVDVQEKGDWKITKFTVWESVGWGDKKVTNYWKCVFFGKRGEQFAEKHGGGDPCVILGKVKARKWEGKDGKSGVSLECDALDWAFAPKRMDGSGGVSRETTPRLDLQSQPTPF